MGMFQFLVMIAQYEKANGHNIQVNVVVVF